MLDPASNIIQVASTYIARSTTFSTRMFTIRDGCLDGRDVQYGSETEQGKQELNQMKKIQNKQYVILWFGGNSSAL